MAHSLEILDLVNTIRKCFEVSGYEKELKLPRIVVIGDQSAGKSSVLDGLMGISLLPRGTGTVTKCPLVIELSNSEEDHFEVIVEEGNAPAKFLNADEARRHLADMMIGFRTVRERPVIIKLSSPRVATLTLIDLPGILRVPSQQAPDELNVITNMINTYLVNTNNLILCVSAANSDIRISEGVAKSLEVDPRGERTLCVFTKIDIMDEGTSALELLSGSLNEVSPKLGVVGVVNRSQLDVINNESVDFQLRKEEEFFRQKYPEIAHLHGTIYLRHLLSSSLKSCLKQYIPELKDHIRGKIVESQNLLSYMPVVASDNEKVAVLTCAVRKFEMSLRIKFARTKQPVNVFSVRPELQLKKLLDYKMPANFDSAKQKSKEQLTDAAIKNALLQSIGILSMTVDIETTLTDLCRLLTSTLKEPILKSVDEIIKTIVDSLKVATEEEYLSNLPKLQNTFLVFMEQVVRERYQLVQNGICNFLNCQSVAVRTSDKILQERLVGIQVEIERLCLRAPISRFPLNIGTRPAKIIKTHDRGNLISDIDNDEVLGLVKELLGLYLDYVVDITLDYSVKMISYNIFALFNDDTIYSDLLISITNNGDDNLLDLPAHIMTQRNRLLKFNNDLKALGADF